MKSNKKKKNRKLYMLLGKGFFAFSIGLLIAIAVIRFFVSLYMTKKYDWGDMETLFQHVESFADAEFKRINIEKYAGKGGHILVLDEDFNLIYTDDKVYAQSLSLKELSWVPEYSVSQWYEKSEFKTKDKKQYYLIQKRGYTKHGLQVLEYALLDKNYKVVSGELFEKGTVLDVYAVNYLTETTMDGAVIYRKDYVNPQEKKRSLFLVTGEIIPEDYYAAIDFKENSQWFLVPQYFLLVFLFIYFLAKRIRRYMEPLRKAIAEYEVEEAKPWELEYKGPAEFEEIAESFSRLTKALEENRQEKRRLEENKSQLLADISHDLKTPLTVIQGYLNLIKENQISEEEKQKYLQIAYDKTCQMEQLIHTFHEYSLLEHPDLPITLKRENVGTLLEVYLASKYEEIEFAGFELEAEIPQKPIYCDIDQQLFRRALDNIINNSLRYNKKGTLILVQLEEKPQGAEISLGDNGIGIDLKDTRKLFDAFVSDRSKTDVAPGSGLGLSITKKIITAHKGQITLSPMPKIGWKTEFVICIPYSLQEK